MASYVTDQTVVKERWKEHFGSMFEEDEVGLEDKIGGG